MTDFTDIAVVGGGPAGLSAASAIGRQLHTAIVFDSGVYRNARSPTMWMVPGWDGASPADFRAKSRADIKANFSTIQFEDVAVSKIERKTESHYVVTDATGKERNFRKIILAVGTTDVMPELEGYAELWAKRVFHCLFCKGYELRGGKSAGVLAIAGIRSQGFIHHLAENAAQLCEKVTLYTDGNDEIASNLTTHGVFTVEPRKIKRLVDNSANNSVTVEFADGSTNEETFLVNVPRNTAPGGLIEQLGLEMLPGSHIKAPAHSYQTSVRGVFAAGDCCADYQIISAAMSSGSFAGIMACSQLQSESHGHKPMI